MPTIKEVLLFLITKGHGRTELELAGAIFGNPTKAKSVYQQRVNQDCRLLLNEGVVVRKGKGGRTDPFRYYPS